MLTDQWISAAKGMCLDVSSAEKRQTENDLKAELDLRALAASFDALRAELRILHLRFAEEIERLERENPEEFLVWIPRWAGHRLPEPQKQLTE